jgi:hypothetical protein
MLGCRGLEKLSILSQLQHERVERVVHRVQDLFQFFPSCSTDTTTGMVPTGDIKAFNSFPVAARRASQGDGSPRALLSILSQLQRLLRLANVSVYRAFNSFPVAALAQAGERLGVQSFQFFPSCSSIEVRSWRWVTDDGLSILSQLQHKEG